MVVVAALVVVVTVWVMDVEVAAVVEVDLVDELVRALVEPVPQPANSKTTTNAET